MHTYPSDLPLPPAPDQQLNHAMPSATALSVAAGPAAQPELPDDLLEDIFVHLDDESDLARVSASCTSFRRVVTGRRFLRRFRSLHAPPVLGFLDCSDDGGLDFHQGQPPRRSALHAARAVARSGDFTSSFPRRVADPKRWRVRDARDGRILLARTAFKSWFVFDAFVIYDPLHRRHVQIPPIPGDLVATAVHCGGEKHGAAAPYAGRRNREQVEAFLAPAGEEEDQEAETSLQVICIVFSNSTVVAFVYSPVTGSWRCAASFNFEAYRWTQSPLLSLTRRYAHSCFFWTDHYQKAMLALDTREMKFFFIDLPPESECRGRDKTVVEADKLRLGLLIVGERALNLYTMAWHENGVGTKGWQHERMISLPDCLWSVGPASEGFILLRGIPRDQLPFWTISEKKPDVQYLTVKVKTLSVSRLSSCAC